MNRDIEFRVWDDHYKYMNYKVIVGIYGNWEEVKDNENYTACSMWIEPKNVDYKCEPHWSHFEPHHKEIKLMQYTGLKDKNDKKIFEGDIVKINNINYRVLYSDYRLSFVFLKLKEATCYFSLNEIYEDYYKKNQFSLLDIEVIGNIYENKEL